MKNKYRYIFYLLFVANAIFGGKPVKPNVWDTGLQSSLVTFSALDYNTYSILKGSQKNIINSEKKIDAAWQIIIEIEEKTQDYQRNLQKLMKEATQEEQISLMMYQIEENQKKIESIASQNGKYGEIADKTKKEIEKRSKKLIKHIEKCANRTENTGRLDSHQRNNVSIYVIEQLKEMEQLTRETILGMEIAAKVKYMK